MYIGEIELVYSAKGGIDGAFDILWEIQEHIIATFGEKYGITKDNIHIECDHYTPGPTYLTLKDNVLTIAE